ncbi:MAG: hypothetical protein R3F14_44870 [Polyangiaceae bacterium]
MKGVDPGCASLAVSAISAHLAAVIGQLAGAVGGGDEGNAVALTVEGRATKGRRSSTARRWDAAVSVPGLPAIIFQ